MVIPLQSPPRAQLAFRVGIVGHRPDRLPKVDVMLREAVQCLLQQIQTVVIKYYEKHPNLYQSKKVAVRIVSPLAEGSDRIVAEEGLKLGYQLQCPLPFAQSEYEKDFRAPHALAPDSLNEFERLLADGRSREGFVLFEMDGDRKDAGRAYGATGRVVLNHADILIAIWDGGPPGGPGGTVEILREAVTFGVPVIWVNPNNPSAWSFLGQPADMKWRSKTVGFIPTAVPGTPRMLKRLMVRQLRPPGRMLRKPVKGFRQRFRMFWRMLHPHQSAVFPDLRQEFFNERKPCCNLAFVWKLFRNFVGDGVLKGQSLQVMEFEKAIEKDWPEDAPGAAGWANRALRPHYAWADKLADFYADHYRSSFVSAFLLGVLAVTLALAPFLSTKNLFGPLNNAASAKAVVRENSAQPVPSVAATSSPSHEQPISVVCAITEPVVIVTILVLIAVNWGWRWHERWMDYRLVAELVRQLRFLLPLGGGRPFPRIASHLESYGDPTQTWMYWHVRNLEREVGLPFAKLDQVYLGQALDYMIAVQMEQWRFHQHNSQRSARIEGRLHILCYSLFIATFFVCLLHFLPYAGGLGWPKIELPGWSPVHCLALLAAVLPALGAALAGINNQGEFGRIAKRSKAMTKRLELIGRNLESLRQKTEPLRSEELVLVASDLAQLMVDEVLDWRVVFTDRPPVLPA